MSNMFTFRQCKAKCRTAVYKKNFDAWHQVGARNFFLCNYNNGKKWNGNLCSGELIILKKLLKSDVRPVSMVRFIKHLVSKLRLASGNDF